MADAPLLDTNVLLYLLSVDPAKAARARDLLAAGGVISAQVLNEFVSVGRRKLNLDWADVESLIDGFTTHLHVEPLTVGTHLRAVRIARRYQLGIYDATILAAAEQASCRVLLSEDMQHGLRVGEVVIDNPFRPA